MASGLLDRVFWNAGLLLAFTLAVVTSASQNVTDEAGPSVTAEVDAKPKPVLTGIPQIDYIHDPNLPLQLKGYDMSNYPFYQRVPNIEFNFTCDERHDGFYASIPHECQVYHQCLYGDRYDFLCPNFTVFDQSNFICHFASEVDCKNSELFFDRNLELYVTTTTTTAAPIIKIVYVDRPVPREAGEKTPIQREVPKRPTNNRQKLNIPKRPPRPQNRLPTQTSQSFQNEDVHPSPDQPLRRRKPGRRRQPGAKRRRRKKTTTTTTPVPEYYDYYYDDPANEYEYYYDDETTTTTTTTTKAPLRRRRPNRKRISGEEGRRGLKRRKVKRPKTTTTTPSPALAEDPIYDYYYDDAETLADTVPEETVLKPKVPEPTPLEHENTVDDFGSRRGSISPRNPGSFQRPANSRSRSRTPQQ